MDLKILELKNEVKKLLQSNDQLVSSILAKEIEIQEYQA
jgi:hypothetical protein